MRDIYLLMGANLGDRESALRKAMSLLDKSCGAVRNSSDIFETAAWGKEDQPSFLNQAIELESDVSAENLMENILKIEEQMGRLRQERYGARLIDIDIIFFSTSIINQLNLSVPHPRLQNRRFVLVPLNEIAPHFIHPVLNKTVGELLLDCDDPLPVTRFRRK
jgi:2-amino-4-hydroxy-6-hydroxymethyldihydropteridine diphosphokinase